MTNFNPMAFNVNLFAKVSNENEETTNSNDLYYHPRCADSVSEDGVYRANVKVLYNPFDFTNSLVNRQVYSLNDENGWFPVFSSLSNGDKSCPIFTLWKSLRYSTDTEKQKIALPESSGGFSWFNKMVQTYVTVQVIEDKNHPELENKYLIWKCPKQILTIIENKQSPAEQSGKASVPVMDLLYGRAIELEITPGPDDKLHPERKNRETSYMTSEISDDVYTCKNVDGSPILSEDEEAKLDEYVTAQKKIWKIRDVEKRNAEMAKLVESEITMKLGKVYTEKIIPAVQAMAPNVYEEMKFNDVSDETTERVNKWIEKVKAGIDPKTPSQINVESLSSNATSSTSASSTETKSENLEDEVDDLPF